MSEPTNISIPVEIECDVCCGDLEAEYEHVRGRNVLRVKPCPECLKDAKEGT